MALMRLQPPLAGLDRATSYRSKPPFSTRDAQNVIAVDPMEERARIGQRPGLSKAYTQQLGSGSPIRMMGHVACIQETGYEKWSDTFLGKSLGEVWAAASWIGTAPGVTTNFAKTTTTGEVGCVRDAISDLDTAQDYEIAIKLIPWRGEWQGNYRLYFGMDDTTPDASAKGVTVDLVMTGATGAWTGTISGEKTGGSFSTDLTVGTVTPRPGWLRVTVSGNTATVTWHGTTIATQDCTGYLAGTRVGFGLNCTTSGTEDKYCLVEVFAVQYYSGSAERLRNVFVASADGELWYETVEGTLTKLTTDLTLGSDRYIQCAERGQKLYIADWGDKITEQTDGVIAAGGTDLTSVTMDDPDAAGVDPDDHVVVISSPTGIAGTYTISSVTATKIVLDSTLSAQTSVHFYVARGPKVFDPVAATLSLWTADSGAGQVPTGCRYIALFRDRLILAGQVDDPHAWYSSRSGAPNDFDYGASSNDYDRAVAGTNTAAGKVGQPVTAVIPFSDDYMLFGCTHSSWKLDGDPAYEGFIRNISQKEGPYNGKAWTWLSDGHGVLLTRNGLHAVEPGVRGAPASISREKLPQELRELDDETMTILLEWDLRERHVHIYNTSEAKKDLPHWWFNPQTGAFWLVRFAEKDLEPTCVCEHLSDIPDESCVLLGCRDGYVRRFLGEADDDDGTAVTSNVEIGPVKLGRNEIGEGVVAEVHGSLARNSGDVTWALRVAETHEGIVDANDLSMGTWSSGRNVTDTPRNGGGSAILRLSNAENLRWAVETMALTVEPSDILRKP